jgi:type IV pilus assembly protein PilB
LLSPTAAQQTAQQTGPQQSLVATLIQQRHLPAKVIAEQLADHLGFSYCDLSQQLPDGTVENVLDATFIRQHGALPLTVDNQQLQLAITDPTHVELLSEVKFHTDLSIVPVVVEWDKLNHLLADYLSRQHYQPLSTTTADNNQQIINLVEQLLDDAVRKGASDIHLEPFKTVYRIRFRVDGLLHKIGQLSLDVAQRVVARLKVLARLDLAERRLPQDGRFSISLPSMDTQDCRASTCPTLFGEKVVLRLLEGNKTSLSIEELGLEATQKTAFIQALRQPQGMILVTGPTGSGKTVTLYSALNQLNTLDKNICSVEDPVEIVLPGINQVNVDVKTELNFTKVLRTFLRQDPDIIMLGEIRDQETADNAIKAAQTGHLVLSTLHTNSAAETLIRLHSMGISSYHLAHTLQLIIAQRLLRKLCQYCKQPVTHPEAMLLNLGFSAAEIPQLLLHEATGCEHCMKGYSGRVGVFEVLPISSDIAALVFANAGSAEINAAADKLGIVGLAEAARNKVRAGLVSISEIQRVIGAT